MGLRMFIGVIDEGDWRIAQYCNFWTENGPDVQYEIIKGQLADAEAIRENLSHCKFITTYENKTEAMEKEYPSLVPWCGADVLDMISDCGKYETIGLCDSRVFLDDEISCEYAFVINFDTWILTCYHNGKRFMFGEYDIDNLPDTKQFMNDLRNSKKIHKLEIQKVIFTPTVNLLRKNAISQGKDPDAVEKSFWEMISSAPDEDKE